MSELQDGQVRTFNLNPEDYFGTLADPGDLAGGDPGTNADITRRILDGESGPRRNVVLLNAAAALTAADKAQDFAEGLNLAGNAIDSGAAREKLAALAAFTQEHAP
jgi:anthranilate phosphoribosyltransferase